MSRWVPYSEDVTSIGTEPRGKIHYLNAETNGFPCGTVKAYREWDEETVRAAIAMGDAIQCPTCHYWREANPEQSS
jgi:hypothetical protein